MGKTVEGVTAEKGADVHVAFLSNAACDIHALCQGGFENASNFFWAWAGATP